MEKLLHERLRACHSFVGLNDILGIHTIKIGDAFETLADEIERCYHPKPVDGDGRPWELDDACITAEGEDAIIAGYRPGGRVFIDLHDEREFARCYASDLKRPTPRVLDADGVEIKVGDTLWPINNDRIKSPTKVEGFANDGRVCVTNTGGWLEYVQADSLTHEEPVYDVEGVRICEGDTCWYTDRLPAERFRGDKVTVEGIYENGITVYNETRGFSQYELSPESLTHREPDSLEKLRDDVDKLLRDCACDTDAADGIESRFTALIERGA